MTAEWLKPRRRLLIAYRILHPIRALRYELMMNPGKHIHMFYISTVPFRTWVRHPRDGIESVTEHVKRFKEQLTLEDLANPPEGNGK